MLLESQQKLNYFSQNMFVAQDKKQIAGCPASYSTGQIVIQEFKRNQIKL